MVDSSEASRPPKRSFWQWLWRGAELAEARGEVRDVSPQRRILLSRAQAALELADRAFDPVDPLRAGPSLPLSLSLYREAAYWALAAQHLQPAAELTSAFAQTSPELLEFAAAGQGGLEQVRAALIAKSFRETAEDTADRQRADAVAARAFVQALIGAQLGAERRVGRILVQRWVRVTTLVILLLVTVFGGRALYSTLAAGPDLAAGKPWRASSANTSVPPAPRGEYLFHTLDEESPWFEVDLGEAVLISVVDVVNRKDCCPERAAPVAIEVSGDRLRWKEVSRRMESYSRWQAKFAPTTARYVRVRVLRRSILHLAAVAVRSH